MKKSHISKLFNDEGLILENNKALKLDEINVDEIKSFFKKYGIIVFKNFDFNPQKLTIFTDFFTETYAADALRRSKRYGKKNITDVDQGFNQIDLHSEASFAPAWPEIVWFYCVTPATGKGGSTTLCDGLNVWNSLSTNAKNFFLKNPIIYKLKIPVVDRKPGKGIKPWTLNDPDVSQCFLDWETGLLNLVLSRYAVHKDKFSKQLCFSNHLLIKLSSEDQIVTRTLLNDRKIPDEIISEIKTISNSLTFDYNWQKNDLVMINNKRFMHGRRSYEKEDPRDIVNIQTGKARFGDGFVSKIEENTQI
mgnify:CR=1 FL=1